MQAMFDDNGLPDLQKFQRQFHTEVMNGFMSEHEKMIKMALGNKKDEMQVKWQI